MPITDLTILQTVRHGWNSYWLRYLAHGYSAGMFFTKHISETMFASELFSGLRARKIDLDATAIAYCHQRNIPAPTKQKALSALVSEFVDYMQDVNNESNPTPSKTPQHNTQGPQLKAPQQPDPATAQRLLTLEHQLATANLTISHLRGQPTPLPSQPTIIHTQPAPNINTHPHNTTATSADISPIAPRNLQSQLDSSMHESAHRRNLPPEDINLHPQVVDIASSPVPGASQDTALYSPSPQYHDDDSKTVTPHPRHMAHTPPSLNANPVLQPHQQTTAPALHRHAKSNTDGASQSSKPAPSDTSKKQGKRAIQLGSNPTLLKKQRQSTLPGAPTPKPKMPVEAVFQQPAQRSQWFQQNFTGVHTESGILRWFGSLKNVSEKQKTECRAYINEVLQTYPEITLDQRQQLEANAASWGIPIRLIDKFQTKPFSASFA